MEVGQGKRIYTIDFLRGVTIFAMLFANYGFGNAPWFMKHVTAQEYYWVTWVDMIFPMFLFLVGMSIPPAFAKYETATWRGRGKLIWHIALRTASLLFIGVLILNAPSPIEMGDWGFFSKLALWSTDDRLQVAQRCWRMLAMGGVILFFQTTRNTDASSRLASRVMRGLGAAMLIVYLVLYRNAAGGWLECGWWDILGVIGWCYFFASLYYLIFRDQELLFMLLLLVLTGLTVGGANGVWKDLPVMQYMYGKIGGRTLLVCLGIGMYWVWMRGGELQERYRSLGGFAGVMLLATVVFAPVYGISKIRATLSWMFLTAFLAAVLWVVSYGMCDMVERRRRLVEWFCELGSVPLTAYIFQFFVVALLVVSGVRDFLGGVFRGWWGVVLALGVTALISQLALIARRRGWILKL